jgi:hypothetical protein
MIWAALETALSTLFPGKHPSPKAKLLIDKIASGMLYNSKACEVVKNYVHSQIRALYRP